MQDEGEVRKGEKWRRQERGRKERKEREGEEWKEKSRRGKEVIKIPES